MEVNQFNDWYKKRFDSLDEEPPAEVWDNIYAGLDINDAWKGIDSKLTAAHRRKKIIKQLSFSLLLLLLGSAGIFMLYNTRKSNGFAEGHLNINAKIFAHTDSFQPGFYHTANVFVQSHASERNKFSLLKKNNRAIQDKSSIVNTTLNFPDPVHNDDKEISNSSSANKYDNRLLVTSSEVHIIPLPVSAIAMPEVNVAAPQLQSVNIIQMPGDFTGGIPALSRRFYLGGTYMFQNSWLLNNITFYRLSPNSLEEANLNLGHAYAISGGYFLNRKWCAEVNCYLNSPYGQTYHIYDEGRYVQVRTKLDYLAFNFSMTRTSKLKYICSAIQTSHGFIGGADIRLLKKKLQYPVLEPDESCCSYSDFDYGLRLGYGYHFIISGRLLFSSSINANLGLKNIYQGNFYLPGNFNRTYNASLSFSMGLSYLFGGNKSLEKK